MKKKIAFITGVTGQDGSYLAEFLLNKNYQVHGLKRRSSSINTKRIDHIYEEKFKTGSNFKLHHGDMTDTPSIYHLMSTIKPDEVYNLAAQSHVAVSFEQPEYTANADALGTLRILESIKQLGLIKKTKFYQAGTSELFGGIKKIPQNEKTPLYPKSPYGIAKLYAHWITINYREAYGLFACNGILFNHESPVRGETFITRKITIGLCRIKKNKQKKLVLGNLNAKRDWGHARDYVKAQWLMLQQNTPEDYVIATGMQYSVKEFVNLVAKKLDIKISWKGKGINEKGYDENGSVIIESHPSYFRPSEVDTLLGDYSKAKKKLGWKPISSIIDLVNEMVDHDLKNA
jgi:GDPmannose 4,6-dehydratase